ncbi:C-type lectin domain family 12 member B-like [Kryptolebias marmoratus]|uniref:C-type lectin domain family 12 member B-like n=1 Tax=Kryptolebias marmoratus TaxID=37003 RepID=UPI0007F87952|nr:C-type lectin domain family 12 member B-like [Kryptolebias marmoratus]
METEEDVCYSTVTFTNGQPRLKEREEDETIYSEVKPKRKEPAPNDSEGDASAGSRSRLLLVCSGILCLLLIGSISFIIYIGVEMNKQQAKLSDLTAEIQHLTAEKERLENRTEDLGRDRDDLNRTLRAILTFDNFPVNNFCPQKKCQPCRTGWVLFEEKCYLFTDQNHYWKSWGGSRRFCQSEAADLVVVDSQREQEFISNNTKPYYDRYHGFWLGLQKTGSSWVWVDRRNDTFQFWISEPVGNEDRNVLLIPGKSPTKSWTAAENVFRNKFICEHEVLRWSV